MHSQEPPFWKRVSWGPRPATDVENNPPTTPQSDIIFADEKIKFAEQQWEEPSQRASERRRYRCIWLSLSALLIATITAVIVMAWYLSTRVPAEPSPQGHPESNNKNGGAFPSYIMRNDRSSSEPSSLESRATLFDAFLSGETKPVASSAPSKRDYLFGNFLSGSTGVKSEKSVEKRTSLFDAFLSGDLKKEDTETTPEEKTKRASLFDAFLNGELKQSDSSEDDSTAEKEKRALFDNFLSGNLSPQHQNEKRASLFDKFLSTFYDTAPTNKTKRASLFDAFLSGDTKETSTTPTDTEVEKRKSIFDNFLNNDLTPTSKS